MKDNVSTGIGFGMIHLDWFFYQLTLFLNINTVSERIAHLKMHFFGYFSLLFNTVNVFNCL